MNFHTGDNSSRNRQFMLPDPYPIPKVVKQNYYYASLLAEDYAGMKGELTAITQYIYQYITLQNNYPDIATLAKQIAITEMYHLELLGKTIQLLGEEPIIGCAGYNTMRFWNSQFIYYGEGVYDKLYADINHEKEAIQNYKEHQQCIDDPYIKNLLERIIYDEEYHLHLFSEFQDRLLP
ncbi:manganese catalase family protein [Pelosinus sp. sgz500959]|uniref:ferritin-like domain-containing protein n=1 Tax=Pelosinus sp. sgz500959 TaxID=3242472 RepID=UPI00366ACD33